MLSPDRMDDRLRVRLEFEDWVDKQPRNKHYPWHIASECACAQFEAENYPPISPPEPTTLLGRIKRFFNPPPEIKRQPEAYRAWEMFNNIARLEPWTFGALSDRLHDRK